jgi:hypothetical protein
MGEVETVLAARGKGWNLEMQMESGMGRMSRTGTAILYGYGLQFTGPIGLYSWRCDVMMRGWQLSYPADLTGHVVTTSIPSLRIGGYSFQYSSAVTMR